MMKKIFTMAAAFLICVTVKTSSAEDGGSFLDKTDVSGTIDTSFTFNLNRPPRADTNGNGLGDTSTNMLRAFDTEASGFALNLVELAFDHEATDWAKFRFDLNFGRDPRVFQSFGFNDGDNFEIQQGYALLTANVGNGWNFKIGKFVTLFGSEVIESAANNHFSRSLLFTFAQPATHTGLLMDYSFSEWVTLALGVVNGWDNVVDNNGAKTALAGLTVKPGSDKVTLFLGGSFGSEQDDSDANFRTLVDAIVTWNALENLTFMGNFDLGKEKGIGGTGFANWWGGAAYVHWRATDLFGLSGRGEYFAEDSPAGVGVRTGTNAAKIYEGTVTGHFYLFEGFDLRAEYRHDVASNSIFVKSSGATTKQQGTVALEAVYAF